MPWKWKNSAINNRWDAAWGPLEITIATGSDVYHIQRKIQVTSLEIFFMTYVSRLHLISNYFRKISALKHPQIALFWESIAHLCVGQRCPPESQPICCPWPTSFLTAKRIIILELDDYWICKWARSVTLYSNEPFFLSCTNLRTYSKYVCGYFAKIFRYLPLK